MTSPQTPASMTQRARRRADEAARPIAAALGLGDAHFDLIEQSHQRSATFGLSRIGAPDLSPLARADLAEARERNRRLYAHAAPVMEMLFEQIVNSQSMVVLTDARGTIIHSIGDDDFMAKASKVALQPGANWSEATKGTNAIGTALVSESPTLVHADEHFMHANHFLTCQASPILDARGNILGVLDVTGDHRRYHQHTMGLVKMSARMIENHWIGDDFRNLMRLHLHSRVEFIGTLMEGILAVDRDGRIVGANRSALDHLGLSGAAARMHSVTSLFGTSVAGLVDHFRSPLAAPLCLCLPNGNPCHVQARFNWATWYGLGAPARKAAPSSPAPSASAAPLRAATSGLRLLETGDAQMAALTAKLRKVIDRDVAILILGETGTGKDLLARAIHHDSNRARRPFVAVHCGAVGAAAIETELFGDDATHARDGATRRKGQPGKIVQADGGTLFLDAIDELPLAVQARLLRVLQERQLTPMSAGKPIAVDIAIIAATQCKLREAIDAKTFREDLCDRINGLAVKLPALRERSDLAALAQAILRSACPEGTPAISDEVMRRFEACDWPGNVRQLAKVLRTAALMAAGEASITRDHLADDFIEETDPRLAQGRTAAARPQADTPPAADVVPAPAAGAATLEQVELATIRKAVEAAGGNISAASKQLGISRNTIYRKLRWAVGEPAPRC